MVVKVIVATASMLSVIVNELMLAKLVTSNLVKRYPSIIFTTIFIAIFSVNQQSFSSPSSCYFRCKASRNILVDGTYEQAIDQVQTQTLPLHFG